MARTRRTRLLLVAALLVGGVATPLALADNPHRLADGPLGDADDVRWMVDLERMLDEDNFVYGKAVAAHFPSAARTPGTSTGTGGWGDSGLWNGVYLGGQAYRYELAKAHLDALPGKTQGRPFDEERDFWTGQRDNALAKITESLKYSHIDITIAKDWQGEPKPPAVNPDGYPIGEKRHLADFGGGAFKGEEGMIMRACTPVGATNPTAIGNPTEDPEQPVNNNDNRVFQVKRSEDGITYNCETSPSRDTYAGLTFGLLTTYDLVGDDFPWMREQIRHDLHVMGEFLVRYAWTSPRPHGYVSAKHTFDGFWSPDFFAQVPMARLNLVNAVRHVLADGDDTQAKAKWDALWQEEIVSQGASLPVSMEFDALQPNEGYYKFNLHHLTAFNLLRTLSGTERDLVAAGVAVMDKTTRDDVNAHFQTLLYGVTGDDWRRDEAITYLREWKIYRENTQDGQAVKNTCGPALPCVPRDQYGVVTPAGEVAWFPGTPDRPGVGAKGDPYYVAPAAAPRRAAGPLPVADRAPSDFIWQRPPTQLEGHQHPLERQPGIDYLTPYWMLRYFTEVGPHGNTSLPEWAGPAHV